MTGLAASLWSFPLLILTLSATSSCGESPTGERLGPEFAPLTLSELVRVPSHFPAMLAPEDNALTPERVLLGKRLFFDTRLSRTGTVSCSSCHLQEHAFADPDRTSAGVDGLVGTRNAPGLFNLAWGRSFFWDGGVPSLELQVIAPILNPVEMDTTLEAVSARLNADEALRPEFEAAYGEEASPFTITRALASFLRALISGQSAWDQFQVGNAAALEPAAQRGLELFNGEKGECFHCHVGFNLTNEGYRNNGIAPDDPDIGRELLTSRVSDRGKFKVPSLRNVAVTAPYMHDGSLPTLEAVVEAYASGGRGHANTDPTIRPLELTEQDKADLVAFLRALTDDAFLRDPRFRP